jgi:outer membrane receptor protein involved in Fe transport
LSASGWSVFTHNVLALTERLNLTVGARWSSEDKSGGGTFTTRAAAACTSSLVPATLRLICPTRDYRASKSDEHESGVVALSYDVAPNALLFASWSRGFKAGGVSLDRDAGNRSRATFDPETSTSAEIGLKSQWFDRRFTANVTLFDQQYKDFQRTVFTGTETLLSNQGEVNSQGVEVETLARLPARLTLNASITYNLAEYGDNVSDVTLRGRRLNAAPEWTKTLGLAQRVPLSEGLQGYWRLNWRHQTEAITGADLDPLKNQPAYGLLSATIGVVHKPSGTEFSAWGTNLTDEAYRVVTFKSVLQAGSLNAYMGEPRTLGVELRKTF